MYEDDYKPASDNRERANIARSARNRRTHSGKGGKMRMPSDNLTKKELESMNGEVKTYRLNEPMKWAEFKGMPDDLKRSYIQSIRQKYNAPDRQIAVMMGMCSGSGFSAEMKKLGLSTGVHRPPNTKWDKGGFYKWAGIGNEADETDEVTETAEINDGVNTKIETFEEKIERIFGIQSPRQDMMQTTNVLPKVGAMQFVGAADKALDTVANLLMDARVKITITWEAEYEEADE